MDPENETPADAAGTIEAAAPPVPSDQADGSAIPTAGQSVDESGTDARPADAEVTDAAATDVTPEGATPAEAAPAENATRALPAEADTVDEAPILPPQEIRAVLEALIFASPQPITSREITQVMQGVPKSAWLEAFEEIKADYARDGRGLQVIEIAGGYQITTRPEYNDWVRQLLDPKPTARLSIQALETLAVIAYKQPVTQPEVIELRGVKSGGVLKTLLEKRLIKIVGRKEVVGRPILYGTTKFFLLHFGLKDLSELPKIEEFAEVLGEEVDVEGLKKAIEAPRPVEVPLSEAESDEAAAVGDEAADEGTALADTESEG